MPKFCLPCGHTGDSKTHPLLAARLKRSRTPYINQDWGSTFYEERERVCKFINCNLERKKKAKDIRENGYSNPPEDASSITDAEFKQGSLDWTWEGHKCNEACDPPKYPDTDSTWGEEEEESDLEESIPELTCTVCKCSISVTDFLTLNNFNNIHDGLSRTSLWKTCFFSLKNKALVKDTAKILSNLHILAGLYELGCLPTVEGVFENIVRPVADKEMYESLLKTNGGEYPHPYLTDGCVADAYRYIKTIYLAAVVLKKPALLGTKVVTAPLPKFTRMVLLSDSTQEYTDTHFDYDELGPTYDSETRHVLYSDFHVFEKKYTTPFLIECGDKLSSEWMLMIKINIAKCSRNIYPGISRTQWKLLARSNPDLFVAMAPQVLLTKRDGREGVYNTTVSNYKLFSRHPQMLLNVLSTHITTSENTFLK